MGVDALGFPTFDDETETTNETDALGFPKIDNAPTQAVDALGFPVLPTEPLSPPDAVVSDSSLPTNQPSVDPTIRPAPVVSPMQSGFEANAALRQQEMAFAEEERKRAEAARIASQPQTDQMPSVFNPPAPNPADQVLEVMNQPGPTVEKANLNMNPSVSGISGAPGNYTLNTPLGATPISDEDAATIIARANEFEMPNNALVRGFGRLEGVVNVLGQQLGLRDTETFINKFQELNRIYPEAPKEVQDGLRAITEAETWGDVYRAMRDNPGAVLSVAGESLPQMIPGLLAATGATVVGGPFAGAAALGTSSGAIEFGNVLDEEIRMSGVDPNDDAALEALMSDADFWGRARERGARRGVPIALFDALSMGMAGKLVQFTRVRGTGRGAVATAATAELAGQGGLGSIGETAAQLAERQGGFRDRLNLGEIALEGVAEFVPGSAEVAIQTLAKDATTVEAQQAIRELEQMDFSEENFNAAMEALKPQPMSLEDEIRDMAGRLRAIGEDKQAEAYLSWLGRIDTLKPENLAFLRQRVVDTERKAAGLKPLAPREENVFERFVVKTDKEREQYEAAMNDPRTRPVMEDLAKKMQMISDRMYELGYHVDNFAAEKYKAPPEIQKAYAYLSNSGWAMRVIKKLNSNLKGYQGRLQVTDEQLQKEISRMQESIGRETLPQIGDVPVNPNTQQSVEQPNLPAAGDLPVTPAVTSQTVETGEAPSSLEQPSVPSSETAAPEQPTIPEPPKPTQVASEQPAQPEAPTIEEPPVAKEQPVAPTVPDQPAALPNPQEAEEVGTDVDNVVKTVQTPDGQATYNVKGKVIELADLKQAQGELQPRDRSRKESDALAKERAGTMFNPARLLDDPTSGSGAPIIARDGTIMSGNGRVLTMQEVYANQPESLARYRTALEEAGISTEGFTQPVFVRQLTDNMTMEELRQFADLSNTEAQAQMSMTERASRDATRLTDSGIIEMYRGDFDIDAAQNRAFVTEYAKKILSPTEQGSFVDSNGVISQEGISRVRNAILASAFDNPDTLATMLESSDENIKAISNAFMATAPKFAQLKKQIADGRTDAQFDITPQLAEMANLVSRLRRDGTKLQDYYNQTDMLSAPDPEVEALVRAFYNDELTRANSAKAMKDFLTFYADEALQKESGGLIPDDTTASDIIDAGRKRTEEKRNATKGQQQGLDFTPTIDVQSNETRREQVQEQRVAASREDIRRSREETESQVDDTRSESPVEKSVEGVVELRNAETTTPDKAETREDNTRGTKAGRVTIAQSQTLRQSLYRDAFVDAGLDPDTAVNLPITRQYKVLSDLVQKKFGLSFVEKPQQGAGYDQVNALLDAYHNLQWMTHTLAMPNNAIGLDGTLGLALPQRAWGGYLAAYVNKTATDPSNFQSDVNPVTGPVILMPGRSNSFAHEWGHALDYHILDRIGQDWGRGVTGRIRANLEKGEVVYADNAPTDLVEAMGDLMNAMFFDDAATAAEIMKMESEVARLQAKQDKRKSGKPIKKLADMKEQLRRLREGSSRKKLGRSQYRRDAEEFATTNNSDVNYWTRPTEMFARAFEAYVAHNVESAGGNTEFITFENEAYQLALDKVAGGDDRLALTYPKDEDRMRIFMAMDRVMEELRAEVINEGTAAQAPGDTDMIDAQALFYQNIDLKKNERVGLIEDQKRAWNEHKTMRLRVKNRPKRYASKWAAFQDTAGVTLLNTKRGHLFNLANRYKNNPKAKKLIESIIARVATDPGSTDNRVTVSGGTFEEATRAATRRYAGVFAELLDKHGLNSMSDAELQQLRLFLTSDEGVQRGADPAIKRAAGDIRNRLLNPMYDYMRKNGLNANYLPEGGYMPRMMDTLLVINDRAKFIYGEGRNKRGAKALYSDVIYENEYGEVNPTDADQARQLINLSRRQKIEALLDEETVETAKELRNILGQIERLDAALNDPDVDAGEVEAQIQQLQEEAIDLHAELYEALRDPYGEVAAADSYDRVTHRQVGDISRHGVQGDFAKSRKLPPEADTYMVDFYLNPVEALTQYIPGVVRKVEFEKRFGTQNVPEGKRRKTSGTSIDPASNVHDYLSYASQEMAAAGMAEHEIREIQYIVETVTGTRARTDFSLEKTLNTINTFGTMALLPRAVISSIAEPMTAAVTTGKVTDGFRTFAYALDEFATFVRGETARERKQYYRQLGSVLGVIDLPESGEIIANRVGGTAEEDSRNAARLGRFFVRTGLVAVTNAQRRGSLRVGIRYLGELGKQYKNPASPKMKDRAREVLQDFGVRPDDMDQFADFVSTLEKDGKGMYEIDNIIDRSGELTDMGEILALAVQRFTDQTIQDPKIIDRPKYAETPVGRIVFGIQSFIAAFQRNVLLASLKRVQREYQNRGAASAIPFAAINVALPLSSLFLAHTLVSAAREAILNPDKWEEEKDNDNLENYLLTLGLSRSGFLGRLDPLVNAMTSLKYQSDLSNMMVGASGSYYLKAIQRIVGAAPIAGRNSPNTVAAEYQAARGVYDIAVPTALSFLATYPGFGTVLANTAGAAAAVGTSPAAKHWVLRNVIYQLYGEEYRPGRGNRQKKKKTQSWGGGGSWGN